MAQYVPTGIVDPRTISVSGSKTVEAYPYAWFSFDLYNDGPDPVYVQVNRHTAKTTPLNSGESLKENCKAPVIKRIFLETDSGKTASVRIFGKR